MVPEQFVRILRHTLEDYRVSRNEKRVLQSILEEIGADENQLALLRHHAFRIAREEVISPDAESVLGWLEDIVKVLMPQSDASQRPSPEAYFSPGDACVGAIVGQIRKARKSADICVFTITDNRISDAILQAHRRNVSIRIITDNDKAEDLGSDIQRLADAGIAVREDKTRHHMHNKFAVFDHSRLLTGSYNWTRSAAEANEENVVILYDMGLLRQFLAEFEQLWKQLG